MSPVEIALAVAGAAALAALVFFCLRLAGQRDDARLERDKALKDNADLEAYLDRFPTLRKMERLLKGDSLAELFELAGDDHLQAMALGGAALLANGDPQLEDLVEKKAEFLWGQCTESDCAEFIAERLLDFSHSDGDFSQPKSLTARQRAVVSGVSMNGPSAFTLFLKHATEETKRERDREQQADEQGAGA